MIACRAYAKLNLCLAVAHPEPAGSPRAGWHRIASWFAPIDLWDDLHIHPISGDSIYERSWADDAPRPSTIDWPAEKDLAVRAHRLLEAVASRPLPIRLELRKRIPAGGGLGGGSTDAAAVLRALNTLFNLRLAPAQLREQARHLGSDVPYFIPDETSTASLTLPPPPAYVGAFGDQIRPARRDTGSVALILPPFPCPTPAVYRAFDTLTPQPFRADDVARMCDPTSPPRPIALADAHLFNDLAPAAERCEPRLAELRANLQARLQATGHRIHMSGSGSTLFALGNQAITAPADCAVIPTRLV